MWVCLKTGYTLQTVISIQNMMLNEWSSRCNAFRQTSIIWLVLYTKKCPILYTHYMVISHGENYTFIFPHISRISIYIYIYVFIQEYISPIFQDLIPCNRGLTVPKQTSGDTAGEDHQIHGPRGWNRWRRWGRWQPAVRWWLSVRWIVEIQEKVGDQGICILYINYIYYIYILTYINTFWNYVYIYNASVNYQLMSTVSIE